MKKTLFLLSILSLYSGLAAGQVHDFEFGMYPEEDSAQEQASATRKATVEDFFYKHVIPAFEAYQNGELTEESFKNALKAAVANLEDQQQQKSFMYYMENYGPRFLYFLCGMFAARMVL